LGIGRLKKKGHICDVPLKIYSNEKIAKSLRKKDKIKTVKASGAESVISNELPSIPIE